MPLKVQLMSIKEFHYKEEFIPMNAINSSQEYLSFDETQHITSEKTKQTLWIWCLPWFVWPDVDACISVSSNNIATMLSCVSIMVAVGWDGGPNDPDNVLYTSIMPGIGVALALGNCFYVVQALLYSRFTGRTDICAQPFGINTPGAFAFISSILIPTVCSGVAQGLTKQEAMKRAWQLCVTANFMQGFFELMLAFSGPYIIKIVPPVALLTCLSSIGLSFLFCNTFQDESATPIISFVCFFLVIIGYFSGVHFKVPIALVCVVMGGAIAWIDGTLSLHHSANGGGIVESYTNINFFYPRLFDVSQLQWMDAFSYLSLIFPVALTVSVGTIQCCKLAHNVGDEYSVRWSMVGDGVATMIAACCGSIFGMTVFIGHPAFKKIGAKIGYCWMSACCMVVLCCTGLGGFLLTIFPIQSLNPIIMFVGIVVCCDTLEVCPRRHYAAFIIGLGPCLCSWAQGNAVNLAQSAVSVAVGATIASLNTTMNGSIPANYSFSFSINDLNPSSSEATGLDGMWYLGSNYLLTSVVLTSISIYCIDRRFLNAVLWSSVGALFSFFGLMHSDKITIGGLINFGNMVANPYLKTWKFALAYAVVAVLFLVMDQFQRRNLIPSRIRNEDYKSGHDKDDFSKCMVVAIEDVEEEDVERVVEELEREALCNGEQYTANDRLSQKLSEYVDEDCTKPNLDPSLGTFRRTTSPRNSVIVRKD